MQVIKEHCVLWLPEIFKTMREFCVSNFWMIATVLWCRGWMVFCYYGPTSSSFSVANSSADICDMKHQCDFCFWQFCYIFTFFRLLSFRLARARYVMFLLCAFILCSGSWEMARKVSIQQLWYDYAHEIFFWVFIILKAGHFCWFFFSF